MASEARHTQGPWKVGGPFGLAFGGRVLEVGAETGAGHLTVATVGWNEETEEDRAGARADADLIAAAPDLLKAARAALAIASGLEEFHDGAEGTDARSALEVAIAKAEGKAA